MEQIHDFVLTYYPFIGLVLGLFIFLVLMYQDYQRTDAFDDCFELFFFSAFIGATWAFSLILGLIYCGYLLLTFLCKKLVISLTTFCKEKKKC